MSYCPNCNHRLTCGCQKVKCSDGSQCCTNCAHAKNQQLQQQKAKKSSSGSTAPTNVKSGYQGPGKRV